MAFLGSDPMMQRCLRRYPLLVYFIDRLPSQSLQGFTDSVSLELKQTTGNPRSSDSAYETNRFFIAAHRSPEAMAGISPTCKGRLVLMVPENCASVHRRPEGKAAKASLSHIVNTRVETNLDGKAKQNLRLANTPPTVAQPKSIG